MINAGKSSPWKATVTMENDQVKTLSFDGFQSMMEWMESHHGEYTAFIAAENRKSQDA